MKTNRQNKILEIITKRDVETQEELSELLRKAGFSVTQATVSRDINELKLIKVPAEGGGAKYARGGNSAKGVTRLREFLAECDAKFDYAGNTVVIKCHAGTAQTLCMMLDKEPADEGIVGTLAGDDTIFVLMRSPEAAAVFCARFGER